MNGGNHRFICPRCRCRCHVGNQVRGILLADFREMHLVPYPGRAPLFAVASLLIIGRTDKLGWRGDILIAAPAHLPVLIAIILEPDLTQDFYRWNMTEPLGCVRI